MKKFHNLIYLSRVKGRMASQHLGKPFALKCCPLNSLSLLSLINSLNLLSLINSLNLLSPINSLNLLSLINSLNLLSPINSRNLVSLINSRNLVSLINSRNLLSLINSHNLVSLINSTVILLLSVIISGVQCCFTSTQTIRDGEPRTATLTFIQLLSSERWLVGWVLLFVHRNCRLIRDGSPGRPPRLSHSSWTLNDDCGPLPFYASLKPRRYDLLLWFFCWGRSCCILWISLFPVPPFPLYSACLCHGVSCDILWVSPFPPYLLVLTLPVHYCALWNFISSRSFIHVDIVSLLLLFL